ncbi:unnamed protein product [Parnassius apollo]|uniref:(apollo) hypothetical protein n=1 Tax=Parnassius apollo TaxID=110799 RepID=A0A8S3XHV5_PARAO|nr:unnamed protein product [Parnassius apollo]
MPFVRRDQVMLASSAAELQMMVTLMNKSLTVRGVKVNASKTKVMVFEREESKTICEIKIEGEMAEQVDEFIYLGCVFSRDGRYDKVIERRLNAGNKVNGAIHSIAKSQNVSKKKKAFFPKNKGKLLKNSSSLTKYLILSMEVIVKKKKLYGKPLLGPDKTLNIIGCGMKLKLC